VKGIVIDMVAVQFLTPEQKREHVLAYLGCAHGAKAAYLVEHGIPAWSMRRWRMQVYAGTLEVGLVPRGGVMNEPEVNRELARLRAENQQLREQLQAQVRQREKLAVDLDSSKVVVEALGKAIALLHPNSESADGTTGD
jgi:hypothetical protein